MGATFYLMPGWIDVETLEARPPFDYILELEPPYPPPPFACLLTFIALKI